MHMHFFIFQAQPQLDHESKLIKSVLSEAITCCKDINEKCRSTAYEVLNTIGNTLMEHNQMDEFVKLLMKGLEGTSSPQDKSCTLLAFASVLHTFSGELSKECFHLFQTLRVIYLGSWFLILYFTSTKYIDFRKFYVYLFMNVYQRMQVWLFSSWHEVFNQSTTTLF